MTREIIYYNKYGVLPNATKKGYVLEGWYLDAEYTQPLSPEMIVNIQGNQTAYAKWRLNTYTLNFDAKGGVSQTDSKQIIYGNKYGVLPEAEKQNDIFMGWYDDKGMQINPESIFETEGDVILYAKWKSEDAGDINNDGRVNIIDLTLLKQYILKSRSLPDSYNADVCKDGEINISDFVMLKHMMFN